MKIILTVLTVTCVLAARVVAGEEDHAGHAHEARDGHGHEKVTAGAGPEEHGEENAGSGHEGHAHEALAEAPLDERMKATCEHKIQTYRCDACRFEVGFVRVGADLLNTSGGGTPLARVEAVSRRRIEDSVEVTGEIRLNENVTVHVTPRISGVIRSVEVDVGSRLKEGEVLLEMESVELGEALGAYLKNGALAGLALRALEREKALFEKKVGAEADMIEAQMRYEEHRADHEAATHKLNVLGMTAEEVGAIRPDDRARLTGRLAIRAAMPGVVVERHATVGEQVDPGRDLFLVSDLTSLWVWLDIYERDLEALLARRKTGKVPVSVEVSAFKGRCFPAEIDYVAAVMSEDTRTIKARAVVSNDDGLLRPGMFCHGRIALGGGEDVLGVAPEAVLRDEGRDFVFKHISDDLYARVNVRKGRESAGVVEVVEGLKEGDRVVTRGAFLLKSDVLREKMGAGCAD